MTGELRNYIRQQRDVILRARGHAVDFCSSCGAAHDVRFGGSAKTCRGCQKAAPKSLVPLSI